MDEFWLDELIHTNGEIVNNWEKIINDDLIVFFKPYSLEERKGFLFHSCIVIGCDGDNKNNKIIEPLFHGYAYFDGVRHLFLGKDEYKNLGYLNYPDISKIIKILDEIKKLEVRYCEQDYKLGDF